MAARLDLSNAKDGLGRAVDSIGEFARTASAQVTEQAGELKGSVVDTVGELTGKKPDPYERVIAEYNSAFTAMSDKGLSLLRQRERSTDLIELVALLVSSIANTPKSFDTDFDEIDLHRAQFLDAEEFARKDLEAARQSAVGAGAGLAAGAAVASMAPTAALWVATTYGVASTGTAISTLSGAAAANAALAWLGGGALVTGGGGSAAGAALLALAGPIGWTVAGASLLASIALFTRKKFKTREAKQEALIAIKHNTELISRMAAEIDDLLQRTVALRELLRKNYIDALGLVGADFLEISEPRRAELGALVNNTKACAALLRQRIEQNADDE